MSRLVRDVLLLSAGAGLAFAPAARADDARDTRAGSRIGAIYLQAGFSTAESHLRGGTVGGAVLVVLKERLAVEGALAPTWITARAQPPRASRGISS